MLKGAIVGFISLATAIGLVIDAPHLLILHFHHAETTGRIIRVIPDRHGLTEIEYSANGTAYNEDVPGFWVPDTDTRSGPLVIYYDPGNPRIAAAVPPGQILSGQFPFWIAGSAIGAVLGSMAARNIVRITRGFPNR
jgi:hypothetical protein